jgi:alpha-L-fucosidase
MQTTTVGYKRIIPLNGSTASSYGNGYNAKKLRITIEDSRACPLLSNLNVY